ncbi:MAG: symmetrical bis(5'-nucleosyl)-tetraphosphatase [Chloroflexi bacterium]|nr:symmetrical bis(5'-nucleosyl)-tetraphosphatase [Chloroflexota bacterium]
MATWAIGDVHGCFRTLEALIDRIGLDVRKDRLWMVGDLVNRGPGSLQVLRWARARANEMGDRFQVVLGNHDLHLIARHLGIGRERPRDTLEDVLSATDRADLVGWLRLGPFIHFERIEGADYVMVHAGLRPGWSPEDALGAAEHLHQELQGPGPERLLRHERQRKDHSARSGDDSSRNTNSVNRPVADSAAALSALTRTRMLDSKRAPHSYNGPPDRAPRGLRAWFDIEPRGCPDHTVICGHWAALGLQLRPTLIALDTGCVWGGRLTAVRLGDRRVVQQDRVDRFQEPA